MAVIICFLVPIMTKAEIAEADTSSELIISEAKSLLGYQYKYGGESPKEGFDPSGLIQYVFSKADIHLPRSVNDQYKIGTAVKPEDLKPGDILFFKKEEAAALFRHNALYIGDGQMIHSTQSKGVIITNYKKAAIGAGPISGRNESLPIRQRLMFLSFRRLKNISAFHMCLAAARRQRALIARDLCNMCVSTGTRHLSAAISRTAVGSGREGSPSEYKAL